MNKQDKINHRCQLLSMLIANISKSRWIMCGDICKIRGIFATILLFCLIFTFFTCPVLAGNTKNVMLTGYWPPSNEILRQFSTDPLADLGTLGGLFSIAYAINI